MDDADLIAAAKSARTRRRWKAKGVPEGARPAAGDLGAIDGAWAGWRIHRGEIVSPEGLRFRPGEVCAIPLHAQLVAALRHELRPQTQRELF